MSGAIFFCLIRFTCNRLAMVCIFGYLVASAPSLSYAEDLCPKSVAWFACTLENGKSVSVCGSPSTDQNSPKFNKADLAYLQYRYGNPGNIEFSYPAGSAGERPKGQYLGAIQFAPGGTAEQIKFSFITQNTRYTIAAKRLPGFVNHSPKMGYSVTVQSEVPPETISKVNCRSVEAANLLQITESAPCDLKDSINNTRGTEGCK